MAMAKEFMVDLTNATINDLMRVPGIGQKRAEALLDFREQGICLDENFLLQKLGSNLSSKVFPYFHFQNNFRPSKSFGGARPKERKENSSQSRPTKMLNPVTEEPTQLSTSIDLSIPDAVSQEQRSEIEQLLYQNEQLEKQKMLNFSILKEKIQKFKNQSEPPKLKVPPKSAFEPGRPLMQDYQEFDRELDDITRRFSLPIDICSNIPPPHGGGNQPNFVGTANILGENKTSTTAQNRVPDHALFNPQGYITPINPPTIADPKPQFSNPDLDDSLPHLRNPGPNLSQLPNVPKTHSLQIPGANNGVGDTLIPELGIPQNFGINPNKISKTNQFNPPDAELGRGTIPFPGEMFSVPQPAKTGFSKQLGPATLTEENPVESSLPPLSTLNFLEPQKAIKIKPSNLPREEELSQNMQCYPRSVKSSVFPKAHVTAPHVIQQDRGNPIDLPKNLSFNGKEDWEDFRCMFQSYREVNGWTDSQCKDFLHWSLKGKALSFFTKLTRSNPLITFPALMNKLDIVFRKEYIPETSRAEFHQAAQLPTETLNEWACRVLLLATDAYPDLPESFTLKECITKFCQGCIDQEAGKYARLSQPNTLEDAMNKVSYFQHVSKDSLDYKRKNKKPKEEISVNPVGLNLTENPPDNTPSLLAKPQLSSLQINSMSELETIVEQLIEKHLTQDFRCYFCNSSVHFKKDCPQYQQWVRQKSYVQRQIPQVPQQQPPTRAFRQPFQQNQNRPFFQNQAPRNQFSQNQFSQNQFPQNQFSQPRFSQPRFSQPRFPQNQNTQGQFFQNSQVGRNPQSQNINFHQNQNRSRQMSQKGNSGNSLN
ncbi:uncharacterized protein LOC106164909 [Lingula anatina]|uniref:Uncharacterized protein LOC106164909 n=1 Tax=Lingula anatina TaxID=7574 RepID=A0A1S3IJJ4_LINAN|nr:uncharacterized protein LOC106164909 [Lingula anatina]|eukprot:XP_013398410.1 uncharacterized protein LOC106164909 [Lingula anatina]